MIDNSQQLLNPTMQQHANSLDPTTVPHNINEQILKKLESIEKIQKYAHPSMGVMMWRNFLLGISNALGATIAFTLLSSVIVYIFSLTLWPMIAPYFKPKTSGTTDIVQQLLQVYGMGSQTSNNPPK